MNRSHAIVNFILLASIGYSQAAIAQVSTDGTVGTIVSTGPIFNITGGSRPSNGPNLFHSFSQFSLPIGSSAIFQNDPTVQTIFSRVTGSQVSNIDGLLRAQGSANLFLMNPNGIIFGPNARLQLGGSFLGTTATAIQFGNGIEFNAVRATPALLSVNLPIGLQMGQNSAPIQVKGNGHPIASVSTTLTPYLPTAPIAGLKVQAGKTLALVGGPIDLNGGLLTAERGRIELGSLGPLETVGLENIGTPLWRLNTVSTQKFSDIQLSNRSLVDVSGSGAGSIQIQGKGLTLTDGSLIWNQNRGITPAGDIQIKVDSLNMIGGIANRNIRSAILSETRSGNSGNISVTARQISLLTGAIILSRTFSNGSSGNLNINASESINLDGFLAENPELGSGIGAFSASLSEAGRSGEVNVSTQTLSIQNGAFIAVTTLGNAAANNVTVNADQISIAGRNRKGLYSTIGATTIGKGNAGNLMINTRSLSVKDRAKIDTSSANSGNAGNITINASDSIELDQQGSIESDTGAASPTLIKALNLPQQPRGSSGSIVINVPVLKIQNQARILVSNRGLGNSGKVRVTADQILLTQQAQINASTAVGEGGNVVLNAEALVLRKGSNITATAGGLGNGGNIEIKAPIIIGLENSDIIANASKGKGGNITITTQGMIGLNYRDRLTPNNDITASSEFGINGNVQVNTIGINPANALNELSSEVTDSSRQIAASCGNSKGSSFVATGRGGMPQGPTKMHGSDRPWNDLRFNSLQASVITKPIAENSSQPIVEASAIQVDASGSITLVAPNSITTPTSATCGMTSR